MVRSTSGTFVLKIVATGLGFLMSLFLARLLGVSGFGTYAYAFSWLSLLVVPATLGLDMLLIRNVAAYRSSSEWGLMRGLLQRANQVVLTASVMLAMLAAFVAWFLSGRFDSQTLLTLWIAFGLVPVMSLTRLRQGALRGLRRVVLGQSPELLIRPLLLVVLAASVYLVIDGRIAPVWAMGANAAVTVLAFLIGGRLLRKALPLEVMKATPVHQSRVWMRSVIPLLFLGSMQVVNTQISLVLLGAIKGTEAVGVYAVATRGAELIAFILFAANAALSPVIVSLYTTGDIQRLQRLITKSARLVLLFSLPITIGLILFSNFFLSLFGEEFTRGGTALVFLSLGQFVSAAAGSVGTLLIMTGHEREAALGVGIGASLSVVLNLAFIPGWGLEGAALATAISLAVWNLLLAALVYRRLGLDPTAIGRFSLGGRT